MEPALGGIKPCNTRNSVLLPAPLGPSRTVRPPATSVRSMSPSTGTPPGAAATFINLIGRPVARSAKASLRTSAGHLRDGVHQYDNRDEHQSQRQRQRQVALACFERNRRRHHPIDAVDGA